MSVSSLALGIHGRLAAHTVSDPDHDHDCFSVFLALSSALGWNTAIDGTDPGSWGMNDAGGPWFDRSLCGWFQVDPDDRPLPVEALTDAAVRTLGRFGTLELDGLEYYVPPAAVSSARRLPESQAWFALARAADRSRVRITLDSGDSAAVVERRDAILRALDTIAPNDEGLDAAPAEAAPVDFPSPVPWRWWLGDGSPHTVTLSATSTEWTPLGLGRVVSLIVEACRAAGVTDPIGVRLARA